jgi:hypothetical protein
LFMPMPGTQVSKHCPSDLPFRDAGSAPHPEMASRAQRFDIDSTFRYKNRHGSAASGWNRRTNARDTRKRFPIRKSETLKKHIWSILYDIDINGWRTGKI